MTIIFVNYIYLNPYNSDMKINLMKLANNVKITKSAVAVVTFNILTTTVLYRVAHT